MWKLCLFALILFVSCIDAQIEVGHKFIKLMNAEQPNSDCKFGKWSESFYGCDEFDSNPIPVCTTWKVMHGALVGCDACMFLCVSNASACKFYGNRMRYNRCANKPKGRCRFSQWSTDRQALNCSGSIVRVGVRKEPSIEEYLSPTYTCVEDNCRVCPATQTLHDVAIPCQKMCDNSPPKCQYRPTPGCGCRSDQFWNGLGCVDQCDKCEPGVTPVLCKNDPCKGLKCNKHKGAVCRPQTCGGCRGAFFLNGNKLTAEDCDRGCVYRQWVKCFSKEDLECAPCKEGCKCLKSRPSNEELLFGTRQGCWYIYSCYAV